MQTQMRSELLALSNKIAAKNIELINYSMGFETMKAELSEMKRKYHSLDYRLAELDGRLVVIEKAVFGKQQPSARQAMKDAMEKMTVDEREAFIVELMEEGN